MRHRITVYALTDVGMVRAGNEDTFLVLNLDTSDTWTPNTVEGEPPDHLASFEQGRDGTIFAVSDGMGGALAGEVASRMAVEGVRDHMLLFKGNSPFADFPFHERLRLAVEQANTHINNESMGNADYAGMGATFTAAGIHEGVLTLAQIGDSRCYLIREGRIALLTHDQSLVWQLVEAGHITEEEAETHQYKNVILQALGAQPRVNVVVDRLTLNTGDRILLCSDGLSGRVRAEEMLQIVTSSRSLRDACEQLVQLANNRGGEDNITVVVAEFEGGDLPPPGDVLTERVERDPSLPYDVDFEVLAEAETTLNPDGEAITDEDRTYGSEAGPARGFDASVTSLLTAPGGLPLPTDADEEADPADPGKASAHEIAPGLAEQLAQLKDRPGDPVKTSVGIPAITADMLAEHSKRKQAAEEPSPEKAPEPAPPVVAAPPPAKRSPVGFVATTIVLIAAAAVAWYIYDQRTRTEAEHARAVSTAQGLTQRTHNARMRLGQMSPTIESLGPGARHDEALRLKDSVLENLDRVTPLVDTQAPRAESLAEAERICNRIDGDLASLERIVTAPPDTPEAPRAESTTNG